MDVYAHVIRRHTWQNALLAMLFIAAAVLLLQYPDAVHTGMNRGLSICSTVIIPTLFPFMLLSGWLADSPLCRHPGRLMQAITRRVFALPGCCGPAILLSLVGGYPAGIVAISRLYRQGQIRREEMRRMTQFCFCGGPGFIVGTVGIGLMGSTQAGWLLYIAQAITAVMIGVWLGRGQSVAASPRTITAPQRRLAHTVADSCGALLSMCGFVTAAAMALSLWEGIGLSRGIADLTGWSAATVSAAVSGLLEISGGCIAVAQAPLAPLWLSLCLGWGGISVHGQLAAVLAEERILSGRFFVWRCIHGLLSGGVAMLLFHLFPPQRSTDASVLSPIPFSASLSATVMLLLLCFLTMLCFSEKKTGKTV